ARGYRGQAGLTAEAFVPDPFAATPGVRLYRTGDLARYLVDGSLEFLARRDQQVKVRGYRIEPGDIEAALEAHAEVREAAVIVREERPGRSYLAAYLVARSRRVPAAELRRHLARRLPEYMLPSSFEWLAQLPQTPGGKIDRRALGAVGGPRQ